jgi:hypothetical protein
MIFIGGVDAWVPAPVADRPRSWAERGALALSASSRARQAGLGRRAVPGHHVPVLQRLAIAPPAAEDRTPVFFSMAFPRCRMACMPLRRPCGAGPARGSGGTSSPLLRSTAMAGRWSRRRISFERMIWSPR